MNFEFKPGSKAIAGLVALLLSGAVAHADVSISNKPTQNMSCDAGVCTATAQKAVLNVGDLQTMLASGDAMVKTGSVAANIDIDQPLTWANTSRLTLDAFQSLIVKKPVTVAGTGALTITTNDGGSNGAFVIVPEHGNVQFSDLASSLIIDGNIYTLAGDIKTLAADIAANPTGVYALARAYDAREDGIYTSSAIPTDFGGRFDGLGNAISHFALTVSASEQLTFVGFFSTIKSTGAVQHLRLSRVRVSASGPIEEVGVLAGANYGLIASSTTKGTLITSGPHSIHSVGGLVGWNPGTILDSETDVRIQSAATSNAGGLVGFLAPNFSPGAQITNSLAKGSVTVGDSSAGGLVGAAVCEGGYCWSISNSSATGSINGGAHAFGGGLLSAGLGGLIENSFATGNVSIGAGTDNKHCDAIAGGLVGRLGSKVTNSYARGAVTGGDLSCIGGAFGTFAVGYETENASSESSYSTGNLLGGNQAEIGGFVGKEHHSNQINNSYWDVDTSGTAQESGNGKAGAKGLTTEEFIQALPKGFSESIWGQSPDINNGYPYLLANPPAK